MFQNNFLDASVVAVVVVVVWFSWLPLLERGRKYKKKWKIKQKTNLKIGKMGRRVPGPDALFFFFFSFEIIFCFFFVFFVYFQIRVTNEENASSCRIEGGHVEQNR